MKYQPLLVTLGDPNGLGPELTVRLLSKSNKQGLNRPLLLIGPVKALEHHSAELGLSPFWEVLPDLERLPALQAAVYAYTPAELKGLEILPGKPHIQGGLAAGVSLDTACGLIRQGLARGLVTCPLNKAMLSEAGYPFSGHTEFLARSFGLDPDAVCMHLAGPKLRVSLVTTHPPLRQVPGLISKEKILHCLRLTWKLMQDLDSTDKPIGVCGLNPHAGEQGKIGREEETIIEPAVRAARESGLKAQGPFPADSLFYRALHGDFSAVLAMYHDQGLAPLKVLYFHQAVNITLGLPFVRISVDHGTGYDLVGTDQADTSSLEQALITAGRLVDKR